jgi:hypothetical protein
LTCDFWAENAKKINAKADNGKGFGGDFGEGEGVWGGFLWCKIVVKCMVDGYKLW